MILRRGEEVAIVLPAAQLPDAEAGLLEDAVRVLESWGLRVRMRIERSHHFYLAGSDRARAAHLDAVLAGSIGAGDFRRARRVRQHAASRAS